MYIPKNAAQTARNFHWCNVKLKTADAAKILAGGLRHARLTAIGQAHLTRSGAKLYPRGGGWYRLSGYHSSGQDICDDLVALQNPPHTVYARADAVWYALRHGLKVLTGTYPDSASFPEWDRYARTEQSEWCKNCRHHVEHTTFQQWLSEQGETQ